MAISWRTHVLVIIGTLAGGMYGFYVAHHAELNYKEKLREEIAKRDRETLLEESRQDLLLEGDVTTPRHAHQ